MLMRTSLYWGLILLLAPGTAKAQPMLGFTDQGAAAQRALEQQFDALLSTDNLRTWMRQMTTKPQHVGSPHAKANAEFMVSLFTAWGYKAELAEYHVLLPTPLERHVEMLEPEPFVAKLIEPDLEEDATSAIREDRLPPYNAYAADGDVTAPLVYVNQGLPQDYEVLRQHGIDVVGKIVIARYGGSWRGLKPKLAAARGAVGCILYSDPRDDGYFQGDVYPKGPYRMGYGTQRGSVLDMPQFPGDPLTPGYGATPDAERLPLEEAQGLMPIPVLPIGYADAEPLLRALEGPVAPAAWRGALPLTYHIGPGPARVHLKLRFSWDIVPAYNVIAVMEGSTYPDEWVIRGNHRDGWVFGAADPISGMVAVMEEARAVGVLAQEGQRPKRTIVYAGWDAEEPGLLGSTEWAEHNASTLREKAVIYINSDGNGRGFLSAGGSHTLERLVNEVASTVTDPQTGVMVKDRLRARRRVAGDAEVGAQGDLRIAPLGSGSDYSPFLQHLAIASLNIGFGGENGGGSYHSAYDSYDHYTRFQDPGFAYGRALAQVAGRLTLRMANAEILPLRMDNWVFQVQKYVTELSELITTMREETQRHNSLLDAGAFTLASDPRKSFVAPLAKDPVPHLNLAPLHNSLAAVTESAQAFDAAMETYGNRLSQERKQALNGLLMQLERAMSRDEGLPGRPWYRHHIYAPGLLTGYGVKTLPGVREAIESRDWVEAEQQAVIAAGVLDRVSDLLTRARAILEGT